MQVKRRCPGTVEPLDRKEESNVGLSSCRGPWSCQAAGTHMDLDHLAVVVVATDDPPDTVQLQPEETVGSVDQEEPEGGEPLPQLAPVKGLRAEYH